MSEFSTVPAASNTLEIHKEVFSSLSDELYLSHNGNIIFHWADFFETCDLVKEALTSQIELKKDFERKEKLLNRLKLIPVWMRNHKKVVQTTMYDLYEQVILSRFNIMAGVDLTGEIDLSFISSTGPFKLMSVSECFNKETYKDFVMIELLKDNLPRRDFRVRLRSKVLVQSTEDSNMTCLVGLEQLTMSGLLLSVNSTEYANFLSKQKLLKLFISSVTLRHSIGKNLTEFRNYVSQFAFNLFYTSSEEDCLLCDVSDLVIQSSFDFYKNNKMYIFIRYDQLQSNNGFELTLFKEFSQHLRMIVCDNYRISLDSKFT